MAGLNAFQWSGAAGHYEVYYLTLTDPDSGCGAWIRYTMLAPEGETGQTPSCALWFALMDPGSGVVAYKASLEIGELSARADPFELRIGPATLTERGMSGSLDDASWELSWTPAAAGYQHVHPLLRAARAAKTVLVLPHADLKVSGRISLGEREIELTRARGGQAHLWGSKHAGRWSWAHCNDFSGLDGDPRPGAFVDGVSVVVPRLGRDFGPSTPVVARVLGEDFCSTSPLRVIANPSRFGLTAWQFEATAANRRLAGEVHARREDLVGVTYHDPDGELAYCYNSEVATMRVRVWDRAARRAAWVLRDTLVAESRAHFEYGQREPVPGLTVHVA